MIVNHNQSIKSPISNMLAREIKTKVREIQARKCTEQKESIKLWRSEPTVLSPMVEILPLLIEDTLPSIDEKIKKHFSFVPYKSNYKSNFLVNLDKSWREASRDLKGKEYVLSFYEPDAFKSDRWVSGLLLKNHADFQPKNVLYQDFEIKEKHIVITDDAAYTGLQLRRHLNKLSYIEGIENKEIHIIVPYMSQDAIEILHEYAKADKRPSEFTDERESADKPKMNIKIYAQERIFHIREKKEEIMAQEGLTESQFNELLKVPIEGLAYMTLFDHKVADSTSLGDIGATYENPETHEIDERHKTGFYRDRDDNNLLSSKIMLFSE